MIDLDDYVAARRYLAPFGQSPWRWDAEGQVIEWANGNTVAFRGEMESVLGRLAPRGLPPMNALVLLLAACRETWHEMSSELGTMAGFLATLERRDLPDWLPELFRQLDAVHALPADARHDLDAKAALAELVFEDSPIHTTGAEAAAVVRGLAAMSDPGMLARQSRPSRSLNDTLQELRSLCDGLKRVDAESLRLRRRTGLDQLVRPADLDRSPAERVRRLIAELRDDDELGGISRMAGQLLAAIHLPRPIADREDLPVGGVSDISNRGPLDRLLLSELAHDDLTLAVRIAVGEALYLRREAPPRNPPRHRAVLIDAGIRLWGVPRVFATAVALAMAATADRHIQVDVYRAQGQAIVPVDFSRREGLIAHLEALSADAHPGDALAAFAEAISAQGEASDAVLITGEDVAADAEFRQALAAMAAPSLLLATVGRDGRFRLTARAGKSHQLVSEARLKLEELLAPRRTASRLIDPQVPEGLPAILAIRPFPLLLSYEPVDSSRHWFVNGAGVLGISPQRCLMHWTRRGQGARMLADDVPSGQIHWAETWPDSSTSLAVVGHLQQGALWLLSVDVEMGECRVTPLEVGPEAPQAVCGRGAMVYIIYPDHADLVEPARGRRVHSLRIPRGIQWRRDRFFSGRGDWFALSHDGLSASLEPILAASEPKGARNLFLTFLDVEGVDGPIGVTVLGDLYHSTDKTQTHVPHGLVGHVRLLSVARNGERIVVAQASDRSKRALVSARLGHSNPVHGDARTLVEPEVTHRADSRPLRRRFLGICVDESGNLTLISTKRARVRIALAPRNGQIMLHGVAGMPTERPPRIFKPIHGPPGVGYSLQAATWDDGSRAVLDSRGMLHLKSSDPSLPELTLVMSEGVVAGWCADGRTWGSAYFTGERSKTLPEAIFTGILKPFVARLR
jgi:hypothetical protein